MRRMKRVIENLNQPLENDSLEKSRRELLEIISATTSSSTELSEKTINQIRRKSTDIFTSARANAIKSSKKMLANRMKDLLKGTISGKERIDINLFELSEFHEKSVEELEAMSKVKISQLYIDKLQEDLFSMAFIREVSNRIEGSVERIIEEIKEKDSNTEKETVIGQIIFGQIRNVPADELVEIYKKCYSENRNEE
jgi:alpha-galactosidase/6-phospho-beta-glucosidase family protein